jgi:hypothetical protein
MNMTLGQNVPKLDALHLMDGIEGLRSLPKHSVDMLLTDPPYGTTAVAAMNTHRRFICFENAPSIYTSPPSASSRRGWPWPGAGKENSYRKIPHHLR